MLIPIKIVKENRNQNDTYYKYDIKISDGATVTRNGAQKRGQIMFADTNDTFGEPNDMLVHVFERDAVIGAIRFSSMTFATPKRFTVGEEFNVYYPKKRYAMPKESKSVRDIIDNIITACESFKEEGW